MHWWTIQEKNPTTNVQTSCSNPNWNSAGKEWNARPPSDMIHNNNHEWWMDWPRTHTHIRPFGRHGTRPSTTSETLFFFFFYFRTARNFSFPPTWHHRLALLLLLLVVPFKIGKCYFVWRLESVVCLIVMFHCIFIRMANWIRTKVIASSPFVFVCTDENEEDVLHEWSKSNCSNGHTHSIAVDRTHRIYSMYMRARAFSNSTNEFSTFYFAIVCVCTVHAPVC